MRRLRLVAMVAGFGIFLSVSGLVCQRVAARGRYAVPYSTVSSGEDGARGLYMLLEGRGRRPARWLEDLGGLPDGGSLVALGGCDAPMRRPLSRDGRDALLEWIEAGGVLFVVGAGGYLFDDLGVTLSRDMTACDPKKGILGMIARAQREAEEASAPDGGVAGPEGELEDIPDDLAADPVGTFDELTEEDAEPEAVWAHPAGRLLEEVGPVPLREVARMDIDEEQKERAEVHLTLEDGSPVVASLDHGRGTVVVVASSTPFQNGELAEALGGVLFTRLVERFAPDGPIYFDEYHLGMGSSRSLVRYMRQVGATPLLIQLLLVFALIVWRQGTRFGAHLEQAPEAPAGTVSYVQSIARLYQKVRDDLGAARILVRHALGRVARHHRTDRTDPEALRTELLARGRESEAEAVMRLATLPDALSGTRFSLTEVSRKIDRLAAEAGIDESKDHGEDR